MTTQADTVDLPNDVLEKIFKHMSIQDLENAAKVSKIALNVLSTIIFKHPSPINAVAFSHDSKILATGCDDHTIRIWDLTSKRCKNVLNNHESKITAIAFNPDGKTVAIGSADGLVKIWSVDGDKVLATLDNHGYNITSIAYVSEGSKTMLATSCGYMDGDRDNGPIYFWFNEKEAKYEQVKLFQDIFEKAIYSISVSGDRLVTGGGEGIHIFDMSVKKTEKLPNPIPLNSTEYVYVIAVALNDDKLAYIGYDENDEKVLAIGKISGEVQSFTETSKIDMDNLTSIVFSSDGNTLVTTDRYGNIMFWGVNDGGLLKPFKTIQNNLHISSMAISPDQRYVVIGDEEKVRMIELEYQLI